MKTEQDQGGSSNGLNPNAESAVYEIQILGHLDLVWAKWFEGMALTHIENSESGEACTLISGPVIDQSALFGLLTRIQNLNLALISVRRIGPVKNPL